ncbi:uncharacterized protein LOC120333677 [Styela clava]
MTDVIDDTLSWEQRRELRRKKRQELLAEADKIVKPDKVTSSQITNDDDSDNFEQERARRRRDREEKRKKEREELEKQLKEEEDARAERERRREERRRQREEGDGMVSKAKDSLSYSYKSTITTTERTTHDDDEDVVERTVTEVTEAMSNGQDEYADQNGEHNESVEEEDVEVEVDVEESNEIEEDDSHKTTYTSVTITTTKKSIEQQSPEDSEEEEEKEEDEEEQKQSSSSSSENEHELEEPVAKSRADILQEKKMERERKRLEEEKREQEEKERIKQEHEAKMKAEREERERRMAEGEAKRKEFKKQSSLDPQSLSSKGNTAAPLVEKSDDSLSAVGDTVNVKRGSHTTEKSIRPVVSNSKVDRDSKKKMSSPAKSQSFHVRSHTENPTRPLTRKNQTRRSLNAMEKQAGDLYSFLSELEMQKSAGPKQLKEFLESSERSEKGSSDVKSFHTAKSPRPTIQERMEHLGKASAPAKQHSQQQKQDLGMRSTPKPPTRSDSMKKLEMARSKYASGAVDSSLNQINLKAYDSMKVGRKSPTDALSKVTEETVAEDKTTKTSYKMEYNGSKNNNKVDGDEAESTIPQQHNSESKNYSQLEVDIDCSTPSYESENISLHAPKAVADSKIIKVDKREKITIVSQKQPSDNKADKTAQAQEPETRKPRTRRRGRKPELLPKPESISCFNEPDEFTVKVDINIKSSKSSSENNVGQYDHNFEVVGKPTQKQYIVEEKMSNNGTDTSKMFDDPKNNARHDNDNFEKSCEERSFSVKLYSEVGVRGRRLKKEDNEPPTATLLNSSIANKEDDTRKSPMQALSNKMSDSPKTSKPVDTQVAKLSSLDDRLKNYTNKAQKQETQKKGAVTPKSGDVANRLNMWETGRVACGDKTPKKVLDTDVVKQGAAVSSRKNMWETGQVSVGSSAEKRSARANVHGADFSSRKNLWLKATQESSKASSPAKPGDTQVIKTGVMSRLNKWEKGEVTNAPSAVSKQKATELPKSGVVDRRSKWENIAHEPPSQSKSKTTSARPVITTELSSRKHLYESKTEAATEPKIERKPIATGRIKQEVKQEVQSDDEVDHPEPEPKRKVSLSSYSGESDEHGLSDSASEDEQQHGHLASSGTNESDQE